VKRGYKTSGVDTIHFVLVLVLKNGAKLNILETRNQLKIKRKVSITCLAVFLADLCAKVLKFKRTDD